MNPQLCREFLEMLNKHKVRYLIVGGFAYSVHREMRTTKYLDVFVEGSPENGERVFTALAEFGAPMAGYSPSDSSRGR